MDLGRVEDYQDKYFKESKHKEHFCVGPEKCNDHSCIRVQEYLESKKKDEQLPDSR